MWTVSGVNSSEENFKYIFQNSLFNCNFFKWINLFCIFSSRRGTGAYANKTKNDELNSGYRLRETDNRLSRSKHRQVQKRDENETAKARLSVTELRQKGLTKYDAEMLLEQGCTFTDFEDSGSSRLKDLRKRSRSSVVRGTRTGDRLRAPEDSQSTGSSDQDSGSAGAEACQLPSRPLGITLRNHKRLTEPTQPPPSSSQQLLQELRDDEISRRSLGKPLFAEDCRNKLAKLALGSRSRPRPSRSSARSSRLSSAPLLTGAKRWVGACGRHADSETERLSRNNVVAMEKDVYEFDDNEAEEEQEEPQGLRHVKQEEDKWADVEERATCVTPPPPPQRSVKLTLRMKRSPMLDEIIESGNSLSDGDSSGLTFEPEYEVLRVEGVGPDPPPSPPSPSSSSSSRSSHRKKRHKTRSRQRTKHRKSSEHGSSDSSEDPMAMPYLPVVPEPTSPPPNPPMKRLRLILGNETRTIDIPPIISKPT